MSEWPEETQVKIHLLRWEIELHKTTIADAAVGFKASDVMMAEGALSTLQWANDFRDDLGLD